jgi:DNA adenine methylase
MNKIYVPPIKSQGIKTKLVPWIESIVPENYDGIWFEPFMGTGVVAFNIVPNKAVLSDTNPHLINFYKSIQQDIITPQIAKEFLVEEGAFLLEKGQSHYYSIRERFNSEHNPLDFLFLNRSCFNGMIRFNKKGGFNVPFCKKPNRFAQAYVTKIINQITYVYFLLKEKDFTFLCQDFDTTLQDATDSDMIYCDPPYIDRHTDYFNGWNDECENRLFNRLNVTKSNFILSTWHHNDFRENEYIISLWSKFHILTREHFYNVGGSEKNRNPMIEALITNFYAKPRDHVE